MTGNPSFINVRFKKGTFDERGLYISLKFTYTPSGNRGQRFYTGRW